MFSRGTDGVFARRIRMVVPALLPGILLCLMCGAPAQALTWGLPAADLSAGGQNAEKPQVAIGSTGLAAATWLRSNGTNNIVQVAVRAPGSATFGTPQDLSLPGENAWNPQVAVGPDGSVTVAWYRYKTGTSVYVIQAATMLPGSATFGPIQEISNSSQDAIGPQVAAAPDGSATVTWFRWTGSPDNRYVVQVATRPAGSETFGATQDVSTSGSSNTPQIAIGAGGLTTIVWQRGNMLIQAATRPAGSSSFGAPQDISPAGSNQTTDAQVAIGTDGTTTVVWRRRNDSSVDIIQSATRPAGSDTFSAVQDVSQGGQNAIYPQVAAAPDGSATAVWLRYNGTNFIVQDATRPGGSSSFGPAQDLSDAGNNALGQQIAIAPDGAATAVWIRNNGSNYVTQTKTRPAGATSFESLQDLAQPGQNSNIPQVAIAPDGSATAVWQRSNGSKFIIQAASTTSTSYNVTTQLTGTGTGSVSSSPTGIDCGSTCSATFGLSTSVTLTATAGTGSRFAGWGGDCAGDSVTCTLSVLGNRSLTADFAKDEPGPAPGTMAVVSSRSRGNSAVSRVRVSGPGKISQRGTYRARGKSRTACTASKAVSSAGIYTLVCHLNKGARASRRLRGRLRVYVRSTFTPSAGASAGAGRTVFFTSLRPRFTG